MKRISFARWIAGAAVALAATTGFAMENFDFEKAWKKVDEAARKDLPRTVTNLVAQIEHEAVAAERWPEAARAFLVREQAMAEFTDDLPQDWLPAFAASGQRSAATASRSISATRFVTVRGRSFRAASSTFFQAASKSKFSMANPVVAASATVAPAIHRAKEMRFIMFPFRWLVKEPSVPVFHGGLRWGRE